MEEDTLYYSIDNDDELQIDFRNSNYKQISFKFNQFSNQLLLKQNIHLGKGGVFWDGSYITSKILLDKYITKDELVVLELGSGTSLPSMSVLFHSKNSLVLITDIDKTFTLREDILNLNKSFFKGEYFNINLDFESAKDREKVKEILMNKQKNEIDYIICSELIYLDDLFDSLIETLKFFSSSKTKIILTYRVRLPEQVESFFEKFSKAFKFTEIEYEDIKKFAYKKRMVAIEATLK